MCPNSPVSWLGLLMLLFLAGSHLSVGEELRVSWHPIDGACFCPNPNVSLNCSFYCVSQAQCAEDLAGTDDTLCYLLAEPQADTVCLVGVAVRGYCIALQLYPALPPANEWCHRTHNPGVWGGGAFSFEPELLQSSMAPITSISVSYDDTYIKGLGLVFGSDVEAWTGNSRSIMRCVLEPGEYVNTVHMETKLAYGLQMPTALTFVTTQKTCGPFGQLGTSSYTYSGTRLVYIKGRHGWYFDQMDFVFGWC